MRKLTQADKLLAEGKDVADVCRELQVTEATYYRWRNQFGGVEGRREAVERSRTRECNPQTPAGRR